MSYLAATADNLKTDMFKMAHRHLDGRRRGGSDALAAYRGPIWGWDREATAPGASYYYPQNASSYAWQNDIVQPRLIAHQPWSNTEAASSTVRTGLPSINPSSNSQPGASTGRKNRATNRAPTTNAATSNASVSNSDSDMLAVDVGLKLLFDNLTGIKILCEGYEHRFQQGTASLDWAPGGTLDNLWSAMHTSTGEPDKFPELIQ